VRRDHLLATLRTRIHVAANDLDPIVGPGTEGHIVRSSDLVRGFVASGNGVQPPISST
jgi:hypothetical protein